MFDFDSRIVLKEESNDLLAAGELLVDMISADYSDNFEGNNYCKYFGGSPSNIAMNAKRLGIRSKVVSSIGKDGFGDFLLERLIGEGMDTSLIQRRDYATSMVVVTKSQSTPTPVFYREADYHLQFDDSFEKALKESSIFHFSCWPISMEPSRKAIELAIESAKKKGCLICFDPNYHPLIWRKGEDGKEYIKSIIKKTDIIKPSEDDAERLFGRDTPENHIDRFLKLGAKLVIMTLGKDGVLASNGNSTLRLKSLADKVEDTTGAGDAFWSGFYAAIAKGHDIGDAIWLGSAVSAYKLGFTGAVVKLPDIDEIKRLYGFHGSRRVI